MMLLAPALVLATVSAVVAGPVGHAHHLKHRRELVVEKRLQTDVVTATVFQTVYSNPQATGAPLNDKLAVPASQSVVAVVPTPSSVAAVAPVASSSAAAAAAPSQGVTTDWSTPLSTTALARMKSLGLQVGANQKSGDHSVTLQDVGSSGYTNTFTNSYSEEIIVFIWTGGNFFPKAVSTDASFSLAPGQSRTVTFKSGASGAFAAVYPDSALNGLPAIFDDFGGTIGQTWGEFTMNGQWSTYNVSREPNPKGRKLSIAGPTCTADFTSCYFQCRDTSLKACGASGSYDLYNCAQQYGIHDGNPSGGCPMSASSGNLKTTFA